MRWGVGGASSASPAGGARPAAKRFFWRGGGIGSLGLGRKGMGQFLTGRNYISKFGKTQSFAERASRRAERAPVTAPMGGERAFKLVIWRACHRKSVARFSRLKKIGRGRLSLQMKLCARQRPGKSRSQSAAACAQQKSRVRNRCSWYVRGLALGMNRHTGLVKIGGNMRVWPHRRTEARSVFIPHQASVQRDANA